MRTPGASNWNIIFIECRCDCWWFRNSFIDPEGYDGKAGWEWVCYNKVSSSHRNHCIISQGRHQLSPLSSVITKYWVNKYWLGDCQARQDWRLWCILSVTVRRQNTSQWHPVRLFSTQHLHIMWSTPANRRGSDKRGPMGWERWIWSVWQTLTCQWLQKGKTDSVMVWDGLQLVLTAPGSDGWCWYQSLSPVTVIIRS